MNLIMMTYPGFQALPRGLKSMLLVSENFFFREAKPRKPKSNAPLMRVIQQRQWGIDLTERFSSFGSAWRN